MTTKTNTKSAASSAKKSTAAKPAARKTTASRAKPAAAARAKTTSAKPAAAKTTTKAAAAKATPAKKTAAKKTTAAKKAPAKKAAPKKAAAAKAEPAKETAKPAAKPEAAKPAAKPAAEKKPVAAAPKPAAKSAPKAANDSAPAAKKPAAKAKAAPAKPSFKVKDHIVYPSHGVGVITGVEKQTIAGHEIELYVIEFEQEKMTLRVPTAKARSGGMRGLSEPALVDKAVTVLQGRARIKRTMWSRRAQEYEAKINSGDLISIAEVVRDLFRAEDQPEQSYSERQLFESALDRMAREVAAVRAVETGAAITEIEESLAKRAAA